MTHGDQAKAKTAKSSQASATKKISTKTGGKEAGQGGKTAKEASQGSKAGGKTPVKKAGAEKASPATAPKAVSVPKEAGNSGKTAKARPPADDATPGFSNSTVAAAFKRALKKYPNAFRKLTD